MFSLLLAIGLWGFSVLAPLGGLAEPMAASVKSAPGTSTYQVITEEWTARTKYHPPVYVEVGVVTKYGECTPPCNSKRVFVEDAWGYWQWRCLGRHSEWQICGVQ